VAFLELQAGAIQDSSPAFDFIHTKTAQQVMPINYTNYHPKWSLIRRLILKRAGNSCEWCGVENHSTLQDPAAVSMPVLFELDHVHVEAPTRMVILTIAHLDHDRTNNRFENLAALCQKHHLAHDQAQRIYSFKYGSETQYKNGKLF
jgi:hypothetical protein